MKLSNSVLSILAMYLSVATICAANPADTNRDRHINLEEFVAFKKKQMDNNGQAFEERQVEYLFEDKDQDADGVLSYREFGSHPVDLNSDKSISYEEFVKMHKKRAERNGKVAKEAWIQTLFQKKDTNGDGSLSYKELAKPLR